MTSLTYAAHQLTFVAKKSAPWNEIINHEAVVSCNAYKSFYSALLARVLGQYNVIREISRVNYVFFLFEPLIDFMKCTLFSSHISDLHVLIFFHSVLKIENASVKSIWADNFKCDTAWLVNNKSCCAIHPLYLNISFEIDFENCSTWLSVCGSFPPFRFKFKSSSSSFAEGEKQKSGFSFVFDIVVIRSEFGVLF